MPSQHGLALHLSAWSLGRSDGSWAARGVHEHTSHQGPKVKELLSGLLQPQELRPQAGNAAPTAVIDSVSAVPAHACESIYRYVSVVNVFKLM